MRTVFHWHIIMFSSDRSPLPCHIPSLVFIFCAKLFNFAIFVLLVCRKITRRSSRGADSTQIFIVFNILGLANTGGGVMDESPKVPKTHDTEILTIFQQFLFLFTKQNLNHWYCHLDVSTMLKTSVIRTACTLLVTYFVTRVPATMCADVDSCKFRSHDVFFMKHLIFHPLHPPCLT